MAVLGPTASGKTQAAIGVAQAIGGEVVSVDSMQVYRGMDIGTAKPDILERAGVVHHMIDVVDPSEEYTVAEFAATGRRIIEYSEVPLVVSGGSGLHFRSLVDPMSFAPTDAEVRARLESCDGERLRAMLLEADPDSERHVDLGNRRRVIRALEVLELTGETPSARAVTTEAEELRRYVPRYPFTAFGLDPGERLDTRIDHRLDEMRASGLVEEVRRLWDRMGRTARNAVNYRQVGDYLEGKIGLDEAFAEAARSTRRLARRQRTWFHRDPRVRWIPWTDDPEGATQRILEGL